MPPRWIAMAAAPVLVAAACAPATQATPAPPAEARLLTESGAHEQRLDDVTQELRDALASRHGRLEIKAYRLPADANFEAIAAHYRGQLAGWSADGQRFHVDLLGTKIEPPSWAIPVAGVGGAITLLVLLRFVWDQVI